MNINWGDPRLEKFVTGVGLVTSHGPHGANIMACEGTHWVSYAPGLVTISVGRGKATWENIEATREFGISLAAVGQETIVAVAGRASGRTVDKIAALRDLGVSFSGGAQIRPLLVEGTALQVECKVIGEHQVGDHTLFVGEVLAARPTDKQPLAYRQGGLFTLTSVPWSRDDAPTHEALLRHARGPAA